MIDEHYEETPSRHPRCDVCLAGFKGILELDDHSKDPKAHKICLHIDCAASVVVFKDEETLDKHTCSAHRVFTNDLPTVASPPIESPTVPRRVDPSSAPFGIAARQLQMSNLTPPQGDNFGPSVAANVVAASGVAPSRAVNFDTVLIRPTATPRRGFWAYMTSRQAPPAFPSSSVQVSSQNAPSLMRSINVCVLRIHLNMSLS
ncbi:hypothetical protein DXG03_005924 [Asterophora parasitica]|uniref:Uncharacterized protein n=1 Tax=Asterophora parasitica TaxID=117018 RepID=A0A9P7G9N5_9AGAR|nr:hypothetical protein DXG03_005924 [Asterophora parasitica]